MPAITVNISFPKRQLAAIDKAARRESRSRSELLREAARMYIERRERWDDIFALGDQTARKRRLKPRDVGDQITAHRASK